MCARHREDPPRAGGCGGAVVLCRPKRSVWSVQGDKPLRCTVCECADAMGVDRDHMDYDGLSQAIPPSYAQLIFGQACMRHLEAEYGLRAITYDEMLESPAECNRYLDHWRRGAGGEDARQGVELTAVSSGERSVSTSATVGVEERCVAPAAPEPTSQGMAGGSRVR